MEEGPAPGVRRVAVVAIHGVGDHQPREMAEAVSKLLAKAGNGDAYCAFAESTITLNVSPAKVERRAAKLSARAHNRRAWGPLDRLYQSGAPVEEAARMKPDSVDHLFMETQLSGYRGEGPEDTYEVLRLESRRKADAKSNDVEKDVDVYDMFWSDLSGVNNSAGRIFGELYQLLFHLGTIGVNNISAAAMFFNGPARRIWDRYQKTQKTAAALLAGPIPILNLNMLAFALPLLAALLLHGMSEAKEALILSAVLVAALTGLCGYALYARNPGAAAFRLPVIVFAAVVGVLVAVRAYQARLPVEWWDGLAVLLALAACFWAYWKILGAWERRRPGTKKAFWWIAAGTAIIFPVTFLGAAPWNSHHYFAVTAALRAIEISFYLLLFAWLVFWIAAVCAIVLGILAGRAAGPTEKERARRTAWTARLTLGLPALIFLLLTFAGWAGLVNVVDPIFPIGAKPDACPASAQPSARPATSGAAKSSPPAAVTLCYTSFFERQPGPRTVPGWATQLLLAAGISFVPVLLILTCAAVIIAIWGLTPSVLSEASPPPPSADAGRMRVWLDRGLAFMRWGGELIYVGILLFPLAELAEYFLSPACTGAYATSARTFSKALGLLVAGGATTLLAFGGRLSKLAPGFRTAVRVALDVDNWFREHPLDSNPTARISARYTSLLRYIGQWRSPQDRRGYDALIIFAHSQGTVITADLLRFLQVEARLKGTYGAYDSTLAAFDRLPVHLLTMGCPLRQLYGLRFPYLYGYATGGNPAPDRNSLNVVEWINAYRTGDYVGRNLCTTGPAGNIDDREIGAGAHTHYWDASANKVRDILDDLIARA
jgi:hypothetical protein